MPLEPRHVSIAEAALGVVDADTLYARVDVVPADGELRLMELELIEPTSVVALASASGRRVRRRRSPAGSTTVEADRKNVGVDRRAPRLASGR